MDDREKILEEELQKIRKQKAEENEMRIKEENFKKFMKRESDFMIWKAHCDLAFIDKRYNSEIGESLLPYWVYISWNSWRLYEWKAFITNATKVYLHNTWTEKNRNKFESELLKLVVKYVKKNCTELHSVLEMMWLQTTEWYYKDRFKDEDFKAIENEIRKSQDEILDKYKDIEFKRLSQLYHSNDILASYLERKRKHLLKKTV